jgi:guanylate kinase
MSTPFIVTLTGPSCGGKSTLEARLKAVGFENVISTTTRAPRAGEVNGQSYYFMDKPEFKRLHATGIFVEMVEFNGQLYGVSAKEIERVASKNKPIVVIVEPEGLKQIRAYCQKRGWNYFTIFIDNPGQVIGERFLNRYMDDLKKGVEAGVDDEAIRKIQATYAGRLGVMLKHECWWGEDIGPMCDLWLHEFDEGNIDSVIDRIAGLADECLATN